MTHETAPDLTALPDLTDVRVHEFDPDAPLGPTNISTRLVGGPFRDGQTYPTAAGCSVGVYRLGIDAGDWVGGCTIHGRVTDRWATSPHGAADQAWGHLRRKVAERESLFAEARS